ncbi:hypothetical protein [Clostridium sardiniense]|uniref:hypothetical protein n=1 Tax=Clostridium sardiniense TaxID=29369 RepID=UPI00195966EC|nr:hypothetical protein [Clostridium sardiniense]MBM7834683.1 hypothetical protein [Clostridium sardiniense]
MKKIILNIILLIILFTVPFLPYKKEFTLKNFDETKVNLIIQYKEGSDIPSVVKGAAYIKSYASVNGIKDINYSEINIIGNVPYKEISTFELGNRKYIDFVVIGEFIEDEVKNDVLTLKVIDWYNIGANIRLMDTVFWHRYNFSLWLTYFVVIVTIYLLYELNKVLLRKLE